MINNVFITVGGLLLEINPQPGGEFPDFLEGAGNTEIAVAEVIDVFTHYFGCIAFRIDADEHNARQRRLPAYLERGLCRGEHLQCGRANVRAVGETEEYEVPLAFKYGLVCRVAVLVY